ncbi:hypothetical protein Lal_00040949, partial [Lupinus albus]
MSLTILLHAQLLRPLLDPTIAPGLLRLHFHDCFVQSFFTHNNNKPCIYNSYSVIVPITIYSTGSSAERSALPNLGLRGFERLSCADILALAARDAVHLVLTGRRDGRTSQSSQASNMPSPLDSVSGKILVQE